MRINAAFHLWRRKAFETYGPYLRNSLNGAVEERAYYMGRIAEEYGTLVFNDHTMQELLPSVTYKALAKTIKEGKPISSESDRSDQLTSYVAFPNFNRRPADN